MSFRRLVVPAVLLLLQLGCGGLAVPQSFDVVSLRFGEGVGQAAFVTGRLTHGADPDGMTIESLSLNIANVPEFTLRLPDGERVGSKDLTARVVLEHGASLGTVKDYTEQGIRYLLWLGPREVQVLFVISGEQVKGLHIRGPFHCPNVVQDKFVIEWKNGDTFTFPMPYHRLLLALGEPTSVRTEPAISVWACPD